MPPHWLVCDRAILPKRVQMFGDLMGEQGGDTLVALQGVPPPCFFKVVSPCDAREAAKR
jgi:hypothetical protein